MTTTATKIAEDSPAQTPPASVRLATVFGVNVDREDVPMKNDAYLLGASTDAMQQLLNKPATLLTGSLWAARDPRNTQDGDWAPVAMPWLAWINGGPSSGKGTPAWGFSRHPEGKFKEGQCIVLGSSIGKARKAKAMEHMYAMGLDVDSGASLDDVIAKLEKLGLFALVYSSFNSGKRGLQLKRDEVLRKLKITTDPTLQQVQQYLREHDKGRYEDHFIAGVTITAAKKQVKDGVVIELDTPPLDKFRVIFPLAEQVKIIDLAETHEAALEVWEDKITGLARTMLDVHFDSSCTDPSRLFYTARHPKESEDWYCAVVQGDPLRFEDVPTYKKSLYTSKRDALNAFEMAGVDLDTKKIPLALTPSGRPLNDWHHKYKSRLMIANLLEDYCPEQIIHEGSPPEGSVDIHCPFEHEHSNEGGTGTRATNCIDNAQWGYWTVHCKHDSCQGRHKVQFLEEMLRAGWFDENLLYDQESGYLLDAADGEEEQPEVAPKDRIERHKARAESVRDGLLTQASTMTADTTEPEIRAIIRQALEARADKAVQSRLKDTVTAKTPIKARAYNDLWKDESRLFQKPKGRPKKGDIEACHVKDDYPDQLDYARRRIVESNADCPRLFQFGGAYVTADAVRHRVRMEDSRDSMFSFLEEVTRWDADMKLGDDWVTRKVAPPENVVRKLAKDHGFADTLPELLAVPSTPFFDAEGRLVVEDGYHAGAKVYLAKGDLVLPGVSREPSEDEVAEAKRLLVEEVLADFPLGGMDRDQIVGTLSAAGPNDHAVTHAVAMMLLPFCRNMIEGPTPGHVFTKPGPGTGASLLVEALTVIASGEPAPAMELPGKPEEISKTLSAALAEGAPVILFDNVGHAIASTALAMALTGTTYQARILGKTQLVMVPVRAVWCFTANNIEASKEILRRLILIPLDAGVPDPEKRTPAKGWLHPNLRRWVTENRPALVWACLTLIQNWVVKGMEKAPKPSLASYEDWAGVMGGILTAAGFHGFLEGQDAERAKAADSTEDGLSQLLYVFSEFDDGALFRPGGTRTMGAEKTFSIQALLNGEDRGSNEPGDEKPDPIQINGWGYNSFDGRYNSSVKIKAGMKAFVRKPHQVGDWLMTFEELPDPRDGAAVYRMTKEAIG